MSQGIPFSLFSTGKFHQGIQGEAFVRVCFDEHLAPRSDPPPFPHKARLAEEITVDRYPVVAAHIACGVNPPQVQIGWKDFELKTRIEHVVILSDNYTISGSTVCFHRDLTPECFSNLVGQGALVAALTRKFVRLQRLGVNGCRNGPLKPLLTDMN